MPGAPAGSLRYGSLIGTPFTDICPRSLQQETLSPGRPITRLMRWSSLSPVPRPICVSTQSMALAGWVSGVTLGTSDPASHPPGSLNTTTSPRLSATAPGTSSLTITRSLICSVFSIDADGM